MWDRMVNFLKYQTKINFTYGKLFIDKNICVGVYVGSWELVYGRGISLGFFNESVGILVDVHVRWLSWDWKLKKYRNVLVLGAISVLMWPIYIGYIYLQIWEKWVVGKLTLISDLDIKEILIKKRRLLI